MRLRSEGELLNYLRRLHEQEGEAPPAGVEQPVPPAAPATGDATSQAPAPAQQAKPITVDDVIDKLNIVRSGKSTKDSDVKRELEEYVAQFTEEEKTALLAFLEGMGQILTSGIDSSVANDPQDPYALQVQKIPGVEPKKNLTASQSTAAPVKSVPPPAPVPIKVGG